LIVLTRFANPQRHFGQSIGIAVFLFVYFEISSLLRMMSANLTIHTKKNGADFVSASREKPRPEMLLK